MLHRVLTACLLFTCAPLTACGGGDDDEQEAKGDAIGALWPGLSNNLDCENLDSQVPAKLTIDSEGKSHVFTAHVFIATDDSVSIRLVCHNPGDLSESLAATLSAETWNDFVVGTYDKTMPSRDADAAAEGELELRTVDGMLMVTRGAASGEASTQGYEKRNDNWSGRYDTDSGRPATDEMRAKFDWNEDLAFEVASAIELPEEDQMKGAATAVLTHEIHGSIALRGLIPGNGTLDAPDTDGRETIDMRAEF